jgi:hypothetical protein
MLPFFLSSSNKNPANLFAAFQKNSTPAVFYLDIESGSARLRARLAPDPSNTIKQIIIQT